jgi:hypothetical protein
MTGDARLQNMRSRQRELRSAVVESRGLPGGHVVTLSAVVGKVIRDMARIGCTCKGSLMA